MSKNWLTHSEKNRRFIIYQNDFGYRISMKSTRLQQFQFSLGSWFLGVILTFSDVWNILSLYIHFCFNSDKMSQDWTINFLAHIQVGKENHPFKSETEFFLYVLPIHNVQLDASFRFPVWKFFMRRLRVKRKDFSKRTKFVFFFEKRLFFFSKLVWLLSL